MSACRFPIGEIYAYSIYTKRMSFEARIVVSAYIINLPIIIIILMIKFIHSELLF